MAAAFLLGLVCAGLATAVLAWRRVRELRAAQRTISEQAARLREAELIGVVRAIESAGGAPDVDEGLHTALEQICSYGDFVLGHVYRREGDELVPAEVWCAEEKESGLDALRCETAGARFGPGTGLPGQALEAGEPVWVEDFGSRPDFPRAESARAAGVRTGFAFPVLVDGEPEFVLEFFAREALPPNPRLINLAEAIAGQLGRGIERRRAEAELERLAAIVEASSDAIIGTTVEGRIVSWNAAAEALSDWSAGEVVGRHVSNVIVPKRHDDLAEILSRLLRGERVVGFETLLARKDGSVADIALSVALVRDETGRPTGISAVARDVTAPKQAEQRVREAEHRYRALVEQLPFATYVDEPGSMGGSAYLSPQIEAMVGYAPDEWLADPMLFRKVLHPDDRERVLAEKAVAARTGESAPPQEYRLVARDGRHVWVRDSAVVVRDETGKPLWRQGCVIDVTEAREAEELLRLAEGRYRTLVEQLPLVVYIDALDEYSSAIYMSPQIEGMLGYPVQDWLDDRAFFLKVLHPDDRERVLAEVERTRVTEEPFRCEYRLVGRDGQVVWVRDEDRLVRGDDGRPLYSQGFMLDITSRIDAERELERLLAAERAHNEELRQLDRLKDEFVALVSHELRTPLTSVRGYLELVLEGEAGHLSEEQARFLRIVERNAVRLQDVVGDLLFIAQVDAGRLVLDSRPVDLASIVADAVEAARPAADEKPLELELETGSALVVDGDRGRLGQLLDNLVSNAVKFTPAGGRVSVRASASNGHVELSVADTGMGIPDEEQGKLFQRFFRSARASELAIPGTGLGLTIAKAIVDAHGGSIACRSTEGQGTTFSVELPLARALGEAA